MEVVLPKNSTAVEGITSKQTGSFFSGSGMSGKKTNQNGSISTDVREIIGLHTKGHRNAGF